MGIAYQIRDQEALYFMTFQVVGWADVFSRKRYRDILIDSFRYCREHKGLELYAYVIMTNHVHLIARSKNGNLSGIVADFKKYTARKIMKMIDESETESRKEWLMMIFKYHAKYNKRVEKRQLWTHENHAVELFNNEIIDSKLNYIHQNPVRAGWVRDEADYIYSSAGNYAESDGPLEIDLI